MSARSLSSDNPYASLFWDMIRSAGEAGASDIHVQPEHDRVEIRYRVDGEMIAWKTVTAVHKTLFLQEAKRLSGCSIAVSGRAQDARISLPELKLDVRVNLVPSLHGEKLVLRVLDQTRSFQLDALGLGQTSAAAIARAVKQKTGVVLLTGPTGSGKTTLLYSALNALDRARLNLVTIEDPIEYTFPGITQLQVGTKLGFADALRAILRQDPDVILVGEVRDPETAALCFQAAATGHLVLSTLHANGAAEVSARLLSLGVPHNAIRSCLRFSSAQRLIPSLCRRCSQSAPDYVARDVARMYGPAAAPRVRNPEGCFDCRSGVTGRIPVIEYIEMGEDGRERQRTASLRDFTLQLAGEGGIDAHEALAVA
jgi:type II secretory ATPase GspE/PulE/Tfp pilus assembly ATPase PilB-like protein